MRWEKKDKIFYREEGNRITSVKRRKKKKIKEPNKTFKSKNCGVRPTLCRQIKNRRYCFHRILYQKEISSFFFSSQKIDLKTKIQI